MNRQPTINDALKFMRSKGYNVGTDDELTMFIKKAIENHGFDYLCNAEGKISALYIGVWEQPFKVFRVYFMCATEGFMTLLRKFKAQYPFIEYVVTERKQRGEVTYTPEKFKLIGN